MSTTERNTLSRELRRWIFENRRELKGYITADRYDLPAGWSQLVELMARTGAPGELQAEASRVQEEFGQKGRRYNKEATNALAEKLKVAASGDEALSIVRSAAGGPGADAEPAKEIESIIDRMGPDPTVAFDFGACGFCGLLGLEFGPLGGAAGCIFCGVLAD